MYSKATTTKLLDLIGFRSWHNTDVPALTAANTTSESGDVYNPSNGIVNLKNINACMPEGIDLDAFLVNLKTDVINESLKELFAKRKLLRHTKSLIKDNYLYNGAGRVVNQVSKNGRFVGFEIKLSVMHGVKAEIDEIWTQLTAIQNPLNIHVFHSSRLDPLQTVALDITDFNEVQRHKLIDNDIINLHYVDDSHSPGGVFWIGYYENDLVGNAVNRDKDLTRDCCGSSFVAQRRGVFDQVTPFYVKSTDLNGTQAWDEIHVNNVSNNNFGLNLRMSVKCDLTEFIVRNKMELVKLFQVMMKKNVLQLYLNSTNVNHLEGIAEDKAAYLLEQIEKNKEIENSLKEVHFEFEGNSPCLPRVPTGHYKSGSL